MRPSYWVKWSDLSVLRLHRRTNLKNIARNSFETSHCRLLSYASKAARRKNSEICWQKASRRGCVNRTDVLTIHLTMIYLHWLFKYRTDLKLCLRPCAAARVTCAVLECSFLRLCWKEQTSCLHSVPIRSSRQVETSVRRPTGKTRLTDD